MYVILIFLSVVGIIGSLLAEIDSDLWYIKGQEYLRLEYLILNSILAIVMLVGYNASIFNIALAIALLVLAVWQIHYIIPYTPLTKTTVFISKAKSDDESRLDILVFNVYQFNENYTPTAKALLDADADLIFLLETDDNWKEGLEKMTEVYPYRLYEIKDNTYGMMFLSKYELINPEIRYLIEEDVPSIKTQILLENNIVNIYGLHPKPPIPGESDTSTPKDLELLLVAKEIRQTDATEFSIVIGDMNDVPWSRISREFISISNMNDPRVGRGFYSTFPAKYPIRFPIDQIYCDKRFHLDEIKVLQDLGSDHLPISVSLRLSDFYQSKESETK